MIDFRFKASSRTHFEQYALSKGWLRYIKDRGNDVLVKGDGVSISHIGPVMTVKPVYAEERDPQTGERPLITPPVYDTDHHVNVRLRGATAQAEKDAAAVEAGKSELSQEQINAVMPVEEAGKGMTVEGKDEMGEPTEPQALSTVTGLEFTKDAPLEPQGKAEGWRIAVGDGWVAHLDETSIKSPKRVWQ